MFHRNRITRHSDSNDIRTSSFHVIEKSHYWCFTEETVGITVSITKISRNKFGGAAIIAGRRQTRCVTCLWLNGNHADVNLTARWLRMACPTPLLF
ncbi:hypothetical protein ALC57_18899 [Trachymyrmex cornetzi]|uniref:Uncharacterized protein n=1 Tax=Trachymyrmex cornetzi TaxID=471704 RepID=A0A195D7U0_9HYME|nr:hypothetical protein ALC57_18899 [Trachymyrmex cornetzi]